MNFNKLLVCSICCLLLGCGNLGTKPPMPAPYTQQNNQSIPETNSDIVPQEAVPESTNQNKFLSQHFFEDFLAFFPDSNQDLLPELQKAAAYLVSADFSSEIYSRLLLPPSLLLFNTLNSIPVVDNNILLLAQIYLSLADLGAQMVLSQQDNLFSCNTFGLYGCVPHPQEAAIPAYLLYYYALISYRDLCGQTANLIIQDELAGISENLNPYIQNKKLLKSPIIKPGNLKDAQGFLQERLIK